ncbi:fimbrial biogenesis chaperone [Enterobacter asburiae]|uniref:fimbrial biogenesis chaperone n=1 Tax=Enterobacter asburiae TaxID=61645 RepID=UPI00163BAA64|nr:molecular chaperone [Enterobacter asburiae]
MKEKIVVWCVLMALSVPALAGVGFSRNRMVYPEGSQSISLKVTNSGNNPYLIQARVTADTDGRQPAPFMVTPPLFRLDGQGEAMMRIIMAGADLPHDRESVFYFSGRAIPTEAPTEAGAGKLGASVSMSTRSVMKVFYRPKGLQMAQADSPDRMTFSRTAKGVRVKNPTAYYQSFALLTFDGREQDLDGQPSMVPPFGELVFPAREAVKSVSWRVMNDYGGATELKTQSVQE